ncbi:asparaginase, partial [Pseudomonas syringae pv. actinidifoliorum]|nr:asparaginase [Pseudomonas syringae pv. actinidifoliorum]
VLVLHGTDTLAYSAAAMCFQLLGFSAPVVFTGSMLPAGVQDSDAWEKRQRCPACAGFRPGVGCSAVFPRATDDACALRKNSQLRPSAFSRRCKRSRGGHAVVSLPDALDYRRTKAQARVAVLPLFPGVGAAQLDGLVNSGIQGLVLECFGSGTGPSDDAQFLASLENARALGVCVVAITQCHEGGVELDGV